MNHFQRNFKHTHRLSSHQLYHRQYWIIHSKSTMGNAQTNDELVNFLKESGEIKVPAVEHAMRRVDRKQFMPEGTKDSVAYSDTPQPIGNSQTISAPHMHAMTLELLQDHVKPNGRVLDVGSGSGIMCAYFAAMMAYRAQNDSSAEESSQFRGKVYGIEYIEDLVRMGVNNLRKDPISSEHLQSGVITIQSGDGWKGLAEASPFDVIHVGAAATSIPDALLQQLAPSGRMVIPVGPEGLSQSLFCVDKDENGKIKKQKITSVGFVPLVKEE